MNNPLGFLLGGGGGGGIGGLMNMTLSELMNENY
jgi:hypothetical protein